MVFYDIYYKTFVNNNFPQEYLQTPYTLVQAQKKISCSSLIMNILMMIYLITESHY